MTFSYLGIGSRHASTVSSSVHSQTVGFYKFRGLSLGIRFLLHHSRMIAERSQAGWKENALFIR